MATSAGFREGYPAAVLLVHAGNRPDVPGRADSRFPVQDVAPVRACVHRLIDVLAPSGVVSAAAAGADLIVLEAALELGVPIHVVVPIERTEFVARSVADAGAVWVRRFDHVVHTAADAPNTLFEAHAEVSDGWERRANAVIIERAWHLAGADGRVLALTVRPLPGEDPPSVTDDLAGRAAALGWPVLTLDPRAPGAVRVG